MVIKQQAYVTKLVCRERIHTNLSSWSALPMASSVVIYSRNRLLLRRDL